MLQKSGRLQRRRISNVAIYNFVRNFDLLNNIRKMILFTVNLEDTVFKI